MAQQQIDRLWEELHQLEQRIDEWEVKIDEAIENDKLQNVIDSCRKEKAWLVKKMKDLWQQLSALKAQLAGPTGATTIIAKMTRNIVQNSVGKSMKKMERSMEKCVDEMVKSMEKSMENSLPRVSLDALAKLRHSVFLVKESSTDRMGVGVGVFIGPKRAVTANHILLDHQTRVYATMPEIGKVLLLTVVKHVKELDYAILSCEDEHGFLETYQGDPASLPDARLALCPLSLGVADDVADLMINLDLADTFDHGISIVPASGVMVSKHNHFLAYTSTMWPSDTGAPLVTRDGELVGLHLDGVSHLQDLTEHETVGVPTLVGQLDSSVKDVIDPDIRRVADCCVAVLACNFE